MKSATTPGTRRMSRPPVAPLRCVTIVVDGAVTRPLQLGDNALGAWLPAAREAMLKRGCLRDRAHKGHCLNCALLPRCGVWPLIAPADPTRRQSGAYLRPWVPLPLTPPAGMVPAGTRITHGVTVIQDPTFPGLWVRFAEAYVRSAQQLAEWGVGAPVSTAGGPARRGALSVGRVRWLNPVTGESRPFPGNDESDSMPPIWHEESAVSGQQLAATDEVPADGPAPIRTWNTPGALTFVTPTRLVVAGETRRMPDLALLIQRIAERTTALCQGLKAAIPSSLQPDAVEETLDALARVRIARDETHWVGGRHEGGLVGTVTLDGAPDDRAALLPALSWGQALGVGKGVQTGAGRITVRSSE